MVLTTNLITYITSLLSLFGSSSLILSFFLFPSIGISRVLIFYISLSDFFQSLFFLLNYFIIPNTNNDYVNLDNIPCKLLAIFGIFAALSSFLWTIIISHFIYTTITSVKYKTT